jgi:hypothetical protein
MELDFWAMGIFQNYDRLSMNKKKAKSRFDSLKRDDMKKIQENRNAGRTQCLPGIERTGHLVNIAPRAAGQ